MTDAMLSAGEFASLLRHFKAAPAAESQFADLAAAPVERASLATLQGRGLLDPAWGEAAALLAGPAPAVVIRHLLLDGAVETGFYPPIAGGSGGVLAAREAAGCRLLFPAGAREAMVRAIDPLDPIGAAPPALFDRSFSPLALAAFAAAIDQLRALFAISLLERRGIDIAFLRVADLAEQLELGASVVDNRALVRLMGALAPEVAQVPAGDLELGLFELTGMGLLSDVDGRPDLLLPHPEVLALAHAMLSPLPAVSVLGGAAGTPALHLVRGASLWRLEPLADGRLRLHGIDGLAAIGLVMASLGPVAAPGANAEATPPPAPSPAASLAPPCPVCGSPTRAGAKFCTKCGAVLAQ